MRRSIFLACASAALAACNQSADVANNGASAGTTNVAEGPKEPTYCFFKEQETKGWKASVDKNGNVVVSGRAYRQDPRYKPEFGQTAVSGGHAKAFLTITTNSGYASPENWWDVSTTLPDSSRVGAVTVRCGKTTLAELTVKR